MLRAVSPGRLFEGEGRRENEVAGVRARARVCVMGAERLAGIALPTGVKIDK